MSAKQTQRIVLIAFGLSGSAALIYEVVWTRALSLVLGSTVYALSTMLATFMAGLALGAYFGGKIADNKRNLLLFFGICELGIGLFGLITVPVIYNLPPLYFWMFRTFHLSPNVFFITQFFLCAVIMLIPTTFMGATFPLVSKQITKGMEELGRKVGDAYSVNTLGAIAGSLAAGFLLIPLLGVKWASFTAGLINLSVGSVIVFLSGTFRKGAIALIMVAVAIVSGEALTSGADITHPYGSFYQVRRFATFSDLTKAEQEVEVLMSRDYAEGHILAYRGGHGLLTIQHNGKMEGTAPSDVPNTMMLAALPSVVFSQKPEQMFVIGLGAGLTTWAGKMVAGHVEVAEIHPGVIEAVQRFGLSDTLKGVPVYVTDARRHLLFSGKQYDIITSEPSIPSESMTANLFTKEFYEIGASRLKKGGVFCQWLPGWILTVKDARACIKTFASVFDHVYLWRVTASNDFLMLGSEEPFRLSPAEIAAKAQALVRSFFPEIWMHEIETGGIDFDAFFELKLIRDDVSIREILAMTDVPVLTDDRPLLEFIVAKNLLLGPDFKALRQ